MQSEKLSEAENDMNLGTGLHAAAVYGRKESLLALLDVGADVKALNAHGKMPVEVTSELEIKAVLVRESVLIGSILTPYI
jgi:hypothetical protein